MIRHGTPQLHRSADGIDEIADVLDLARKRLVRVRGDANLHGRALGDEAEVLFIDVREHPHRAENR